MKTLLVFATLFAVFTDTAPATDRTEPIDIGSKRELFVDQHLIEKLHSARLTLHHPQAREIAIRFDKPWEGNTSGYPTVMLDGDLFKMIYRGHRMIWDGGWDVFAAVNGG